jgi:hypothetical protein
MGKIDIESQPITAEVPVQTITPLTPLENFFTSALKNNLERTIYTQEEIEDMFLDGFQLVKSAEKKITDWVENRAINLSNNTAA